MFRDNEGKFTEPRRIGRTGNRAVLWGSLIFMAICGSLVAGHMMLDEWSTASIATGRDKNAETTSWIQNHDLIIAGVAEAAQMDRLDAKIRQLKDGVLDTLEKCESGGRKEEDGIVVLDSNDKGSYGPYQWQRTSYMHYYEKQTGEQISGRDAIIHALQRDKARALAEFVIFETANGVDKDWVNCSAWHGLQERVEMIKMLEA